MTRRFILCVCFSLLVPCVALAQWWNQPPQKIDPPSYEAFWQEAWNKPKADLLPWVVSPMYYAEPVGITTTCVSDGMYKECTGALCIMKKCPMDFPACLGGMCTKPDDIFCLDFDSTEVFAVLSNTPGKPGGYLTVAKSDPSLVNASKATEALGFNPAIKQSGQDTCKSTYFLEERVCHDGRLTMVSVNCTDIGAGWKCLQAKGGGYCGNPAPPPPLEPAPVDVCPDIEGVQTKFVYDLDGDGIPDSCDPPLVLPDVCPEVEGFQEEFLYDLDGDGEKESCVPVEKDFCQDPDPALSYPTGTLYSYDDQWHMGFCVDGGNDEVLHVICGENGEWFTDITECEFGMPCVNGACAQCYDSDGDDYTNKGFAMEVKTDGTFKSVSDTCLPGTNYDMLYDHVCINNMINYQLKVCGQSEICVEEPVSGQIQLTCKPAPYPPTCTDHDGGADFYTQSYVDGVDKWGNSFAKSDYCQHMVSTDMIVEFICVNNIAVSTQQYCASDEICEENTVIIDGQPVDVTECVPAENPMTCEDSDGEDFATKGKVTGISKQGLPYATNDYCLNVSNTHAIVEQICFGDTPSVKMQYCKADELCKEVFATGASGATTSTFSCVPSCTDTDPANNPNAPGTVYDFKNVPYPDVCEGDILYQYQCDMTTGTKLEAGTTTCPNGCEGGACQ